jgi:hypothetical protein
VATQLTREDLRQLGLEDDAEEGAEFEEEEDGGEELVPRVPWEEHFAWLVENAEAGDHTSIFAPTKGGKTHLIRFGLLPLWQRYPVLWIRFKQKDKTLRQLGKVVHAYPSWDQRLRYQARGINSPKWETDPEWFILALPQYRWSPSSKAESPAWQRARRIAGVALDRAYAEGGWVVVVDEVRGLAGKDAPALALEAVLENQWQRGRDQPLTVIAGTQQPANAPGSMYDQPAHVYLGQTGDVGRHQRLSEIGGDTETIKAVLPTLQLHEFLYVNRFTRRMEIVKAPPA